MKHKMLFFFGLLILFSFFASGADIGSKSFSGISSSALYSNSYSRPSFGTYYSSENINTYWPILGDREQCDARQDILLQIAPFGCQPAVVRSDLLAEQNVPVFCQIDALQVNPLIDLQEIRNIRFTGNYPKEVSVTGFHPARAALRTRDKLLGDPLINNIGYVVVVLKRNPVEKDLPELINMTLQAQIDYRAGNAYGIGRTEFILEPVSDERWESEKLKNSFWQGRYFARLEEARPEYAIVTIYKGDKRISTIRAERGKVSKEIFLPGLYCQAGLQINYGGFVGAEPKAGIEIDYGDGKIDRQDVYEGSSILEKCSVRKLDINEATREGELSVSCPNRVFKLSLKSNSNIILSLDGDYVENDANKVLKVILAGQDTGISIKNKEVLNGDSKIGIIKEGKIVLDSSANGLISADLFSVLNNAKISGKSILPSLSGDSGKKKIVDIEYNNNSDFEDYFDGALSDFEGVADNFPSERTNAVEGEKEGFYGIDALDEGIGLASMVKGKEESRIRLIQKFIDNYPESSRVSEKIKMLNLIKGYDTENSGSFVEIDGNIYFIRLIGFDVPQNSKLSYATFSFSDKPGLTEKISLKNTKVINDRKNSSARQGIYSITLEKIFDEDRVQVSVSCLEESTSPVSRSLRIGEDAVEFCKGGKIKVDEINWESVAKVSLIPTSRGTRVETNITIGIGIEKRAIQLSPEKTQEMIENLNKSIQKWDAISNKLSKVVSGLKGACFATAAVLTVKNFVNGLNGESIARQNVMSGKNGWTERCKNAISNGKIILPDGSSKAANYKSLTECLNDNRGLVSGEVNAWSSSIKETNEKIKEIENKPGVRSSSSSGDIVDTKKLKSEYANYLRSQGVEVPSGDDLDYVTIEDLRSLDSLRRLKSGGSNIHNDKSYEDILKKVKESGDLSKNIKASREIAGDFSSEPALVGRASTASVVRTNVARVSNVGENSAKIGQDGVINFGQSSFANVIAGKEGENKKNSFNSAMFVVADREIIKIEGDGSETKESKRGEYVVLGYLDNAGKINPYGVYKYTRSGNEITLHDAEPRYDVGASKEGLRQFESDFNIKEYRNAGGQDFVNPIRSSDQKVEYFVSGPYKDLAALISFDVRNGWYARVDSVASFGDKIQAYDKSGQPRIFDICNVGSDGAIDQEDECQTIHVGINDNIPVLGLDSGKSRSLVSKAQLALLEASRQKKISSSVGAVTFENQNLRVGDGTVPIPRTNCQDFMSPEDCQLMFNVCDPVICPASRCNLGGQYQVADVIQSGIVGSTLLCLPNVREGIAIPICLTGIQAGIDGFVSILKNHRDCLTESLKSGQHVGICDEIYSIYLCEFFWKQVAPFADLIVPTILQSVLGQGTRGGGEYLTVAGAWDNAKASVDYFTQSYAVNSFKAFNVRSVAEAGTSFCKSFISAKSPSSFKTLTQPDSPPQFHAWFSSNKYTDATVPPTSQYKVFYHIYSGKDSGVWYSVYLKSPETSQFYSISPYVQVQSGFITKGNYASETRDFTAPEGYKELCVRINNEEECGFGQVSTSFAVNFVRDQFVADELTNGQISSEKECIFGSSSVGSLLNPNLQSGVEGVISSDASSKGVVRVCSTRNPGASTNPSRFVDVGNCGDTGVRCWLDKDSVDRSITAGNELTRNATLSELEKINKENLGKQGYVINEGDFIAQIKVFEERYEVIKNKYDNVVKVNVVEMKRDVEPLLFSINAFEDKVVYNHHKARVFLLKGKIKKVGALGLAKEYSLLKQGVDDKNVVGGVSSGSFDSTESRLTLNQDYDLNNPSGKEYVVFLDDEDTRIVIKDMKVYYDDNPDYIGSINEKGEISLFEYSKEFISDELFNLINFGKIDKSVIITYDSLSEKITPKESKDVADSGNSEKKNVGGEIVLSLDSEYKEKSNLIYKILVNGKDSEIYIEKNKIYLTRKLFGYDGLSFDLTAGSINNYIITMLNYENRRNYPGYQILTEEIYSALNGAKIEGRKIISKGQETSSEGSSTVSPPAGSNGDYVLSQDKESVGGIDYYFLYYKSQKLEIALDPPYLELSNDKSSIIKASIVLIPLITSSNIKYDIGKIENNKINFYQGALEYVESSNKELWGRNKDSINYLDGKSFENFKIKSQSSLPAEESSPPSGVGISEFIVNSISNELPVNEEPLNIKIKHNCKNVILIIYKDNQELSTENINSNDYDKNTNPLANANYRFVANCYDSDGKLIETKEKSIVVIPDIRNAN